MRTLVLADCHHGNPGRYGGELRVGFNERGRHVLDAFITALKTPFDRLVICGDLFDSSSPAPQVVTAVAKALMAAADRNTEAQQQDVTVHIIRGNHDMVSAHPDDDALGSLALLGMVVYSEPDVDETSAQHPMVLVPFRTGRAKDWLPDAVSAVVSRRAAATAGLKFEKPKTFSLFLHLGIKDSNTAPWLREAHDAIDLETLEEISTAHGFTHIFAGNWHEPKRWTFDNGCIVTQVGCTAPTGWDNPGLGYGTAVLHEAPQKKIPVSIRVPGPRFLKKAEDVEEAIEQKCIPFLDVTTTSEEEHAEAQAVLAAHPMMKGEVMADTSEAVAALRTATGLARSATTVEEAVAKYVQEMAMPEGVDRERVLANVKRFLVGGA